MHIDTILFGVILLTIVWAFIERKLLLTTKHIISSTKLPEALNNTSFVVLADLHNCTFGRNNERLIKRIKALEPDFIIVAGDMINKKELSYPSDAFTLLEELVKSYTVYYAYGNHEQRLERIGRDAVTEWTQKDRECNSTWVEYKKRLKKAKVIFLDNESIQYNLHSASLRITGVSLPDEFFRSDKELSPKDMRALVGKSSEELFQILIAHNPVHFNAYADWGADITLSGHVHGGMMRLPGIGGVISPQAKFFPKYDSGNHTKGNRHLIISRGLGSHSIMPRLFNIPEIIQVELSKGNKD